MRLDDIRLFSENATFLEFHFQELDTHLEVQVWFEGNVLAHRVCAKAELQDISMRFTLLSRIVDNSGEVILRNLGIQLADIVFPKTLVSQFLYQEMNDLVLTFFCNSDLTLDLPWEAINWAKNKIAPATVNSKFHVIRVVSSIHEKGLMRLSAPKFIRLSEDKKLHYVECELSAIFSLFAKGSKSLSSIVHIAGHLEENFSRTDDCASLITEVRSAFLCTIGACYSAGFSSSLAVKLVKEGGLTSVGVAGLWPDFESARVFSEFYRVLSLGEPITACMHFARRLLVDSTLLATRIQLITSESTYRLAVSRSRWPQFEDVLHQASSLIGRRNELRQIYKALSDSKVSVVLVTGFGGIGKTRLAEVFYEATQVKGGLKSVFIRADLCLNVDMVLLHTAAAIGEVAELSSNEPFSGLIILDTLEHFEDSRLVLKSVCTAHPSAKVLATSRHRIEWDKALEIRLGALRTVSSRGKPSEAMTLVRKELGSYNVSRKESEYLKEMVSLLEGHPLAIILAANRCRQLGIDSVVDSLRKSLLETLEVLEFHNTKHSSMSRVVWASLKLLDVESLSCIHKLSIFSSPFDRARAQSVLQSGFIGTSKSIELLFSASLLELVEAESAHYKVMDPIREALVQFVGPWSSFDIEGFIEGTLAKAKQVSQLGWSEKELRWSNLGRDLRQASIWAVERNSDLIGELFNYTARPQFEHGDMRSCEILCKTILNSGLRTADQEMEALGLLGAIQSRMGQSPLEYWNRRAILAEECGRSDVAIDSYCDLALDSHLSQNEQLSFIQRLEEDFVYDPTLDPFLKATVWATAAEHFRLNGENAVARARLVRAEFEINWASPSQFAPYAIQLITYLWINLNASVEAMRAGQRLLEVSIEGSRAVHMSWLACQLCESKISCTDNVRLGVLASARSAIRSRPTKHDHRINQYWNQLRKRHPQVVKKWQSMMASEDWRSIAARALHEWRDPSMP